MRDIKAIRHKHLNSDCGEYAQFWFDDFMIGCADIRPEGYLVWGKRKPVATIEKAAHQIIFTKCQQLSKELDKWEDMLETLSATNNG